MYDVCMQCGRADSLIDPITGECELCMTRREYEENDACAKCYINVRDYKHPRKLCRECQIEEGEINELG